jgi:hypothetical protein
MRNRRHGACKGSTQMYSRKIFTSLGFALALVLMGTSGCSAPVEDNVRQHAADRLDVSEDALRVTERSDLSTPDHRFFRVTLKKDNVELVVVTNPDGKIITDARNPDAFAVLAGAEKLAERFELLGGSRVAGWYGAMGGGQVCGELVDDGVKNPVAIENLEGGARRLSYRFFAKNGPKRCQLIITADGKLGDVTSIDTPIAQRS